MQSTINKFVDKIKHIIAKNNGIPAIIELLANPHDNVVKQAVRALTNLVKDGKIHIILITIFDSTYAHCRPNQVLYNTRKWRYRDSKIIHRVLSYRNMSAFTQKHRYLYIFVMYFVFL